MRCVAILRSYTVVPITLVLVMTTGVAAAAAAAVAATVVSSKGQRLAADLMQVSHMYACEMCRDPAEFARGQARL